MTLPTEAQTGVQESEGEALQELQHWEIRDGSAPYSKHEHICMNQLCAQHQTPPTKQGSAHQTRALTILTTSILSLSLQEERMTSTQLCSYSLLGLELLCSRISEENSVKPTLCYSKVVEASCSGTRKESRSVSVHLTEMVGCKLTLTAIQVSRNIFPAMLILSI